VPAGRHPAGAREGRVRAHRAAPLSRGAAGSERCRFTGRIGGKRLKPGSYKLVATPTANGQTGLPVRARFRIIK
jgi:hypothetical protein